MDERRYSKGPFIAVIAAFVFSAAGHVVAFYLRDIVINM